MVSVNHRVVSVVERSEIRALDLQSEGPGFNFPHHYHPRLQVEFVHGIPKRGIPEVKSSTMLVNSQLVCLCQLQFK